MNQPTASEAFYAALLDDDAEQLYDRAPCGYLTTTPDGTLVKVNETFLGIAGRTREELVGRRSFADLLTAGGRIYHETHYAPLLQMHGTAREVAFEIARPDGQRVPVLVNAVLDVDNDGGPSVVRVAVFDATQRREYERELLRAKQRAEQSEVRARALARTLQATLIPPSPPRIPGLDVSAAYRPAGDGEEVGGDFYDIFQIRDDDWVVVLGDVCGKGVEAAVVTSLVRHNLRALTVQLDSPAEVLSSLNDVLLADGRERFATVVVVRLRRTADGWQATMSSGGHPLPLLATGETVTEVGVPGALVGVLAEVVCTDTVLPLRPGDVLMMYTDGVTEGRRAREFYGDARLQQALAAHRAAERPAEVVLDEVLDFQLGVARDDIAVVAVRVPSG